MPHALPRALGLALAAAAFAVIAARTAPQSAAQTGDGWVTLIDDKTMGDWNRIGEDNWRLEDGSVVADKKMGESLSYLQSKSPYKDFMLHVEFWASDDANSGVFLRCTDRTKVTASTCYEVNIFDQRPDPTYGTGAIVGFSEVDPMPKAGGKWNTFEITAKGRDVTVILNGQKTAVLRTGIFPEGPIALQHGSGVIKFRKVTIKPL